MNDKITFTVRDTGRGGYGQIEVSATNVNGVCVKLKLLEERTEYMSLTYSDWMKLFSAVKTIGVISPHLKKDL